MLRNIVLLALAALVAGQTTVFTVVSTVVVSTEIETELTTSTKTNFVTETVEVQITLPVTTKTHLLPAVTPVVTVTNNLGSTIVSTVVVGGGSTTTVVNPANPTVTGPAITVTRPGTKTVYTTLTGLNTVTHTVTSGYTTIRNCLPTTTIITTVTTPVPTATSPAGEVVTFHRQNCATFVCPAGSSTVTVNGAPKSCTLIYYKAALISTTCMLEYCCSNGNSSDGGPTIRPTTCAASGLSCPAGSSMLHTSTGASVPCLHSYQKNQLVASTCDQSVCCSQGSGGVGGVQTVTVTAGQSDNGSVQPTASTGKSISCKAAVKCAVYAKNKKTNYIKKCIVNASDDDFSCGTENCCNNIRKK